ncbi:hypothetical protein [Reyranella massiliensis]|uniref:hypothetical protein n=1 Tax=Reyranella massiliensis TaxID=445220 RepID=UPI0005C29827|nr:hypothetical protein [Reyranella massiliensis]
MPRLVLPLAIAALLLAAIAPAQAQDKSTPLPTPLGLRGFNLGATLDEIRRQKFPDQTVDDVRLICTGDKLSDEARMNFGPDNDLGKIGVKRCSFYSTANDKVREIQLNVGGKDSTVRFLITPKSADPAISERLFQIVVRTESAHFDDLEAAYVARYGQPVTHSRSNNRYRIWESRHATLVMIDEPPTLDITYLDTKLERIVGALEKKAANPGADKL